MMKTDITNAIFSLSGASIMIGVLGFISGIVTIFIDVNLQISVKWLIFLVLVFASLSIILLKVIHDQSNKKSPPAPFETPFRYVSEERVFVIHRNEYFLNNIVVGCYAQKDEIDRLAYLGVVHLVQDRVIQIKIQIDFGVLDKIPASLEELKNIAIRPVVPISALEQMNSKESSDE